MSNIYTVEKKKKLMEKITRLTSRSDFEQVTKIIAEHNKNIESMKNANAMFLKFGSLTNETYIELSKFVDKIEQRKLKQMKEEIMESSDVFSAEEFSVGNNTSEKNMSKKLRLTNNESHIINRVKYEKELKKNENMSEDYEDLQIFDPTSFGKKQSKPTKGSSDIFIHADEDDEIQAKNTKTTKPTKAPVKTLKKGK